METMYYNVLKLDGDYAVLQRTDAQVADTLLIARALIPLETDEGSKLIYENLSYSIID